MKPTVILIPLSEEIFLLVGAGFSKIFTWLDLQIFNPTNFTESY